MPPETPAPLGPTVAPSPVPPPAAAPRDLRTTALAVGAVAVALVLYLSFTHLPGGARQPSTPFPLYDGGSLAFFVVKGGSVVQSQTPVAFPDAPFKTRFVAATLPSGDTPILIDTKGVYAATLAVVRSDGTLITLVDDGVPKMGLTDRAGGLILYAAYAEATSSNGVPMGDWRLMRVSAYDTAAPKMLGVGFSPVFAGNGAVIALAPEGLVSVDPVDGTRETLIDRPGVLYGVGAVSTDATVVVLPNAATHALDVFMLSALNPRQVSYVASIPGDADAVTFTGPAVFSVKVGNVLTQYAVEDGAVVTKGSYTFAL